MIDRGHDLHGFGKGFGHWKHRPDDCDDGSGGGHADKGGGDRRKGHERDDDGIIDPGHDLHGKGKGLGHTKHGGGSDGGSHGTGGSGPGDDCGCTDYLCGGNNIVDIEVHDEDIAADPEVVDLASPYGADDANTLYAKVGGADADMFTVDAASGEVSFADGQVPEFNEGGDNTYEVVVRTSNVLNPCECIQTTLRIEVTEGEDDGEPAAGPVFLDVISVTERTLIGDVDPILARLEGSVMDESAYSLEHIVDSDDDNLGALFLDFSVDNDATPDTLEFVVRVDGSPVLGTGGTGTTYPDPAPNEDVDSSYDFVVAMDAGEDVLLSSEIHADIFSSG